MFRNFEARTNYVFTKMLATCDLATAIHMCRSRPTFNACPNRLILRSFKAKLAIFACDEMTKPNVPAYCRTHVKYDTTDRAVHSL